MHDQKATLKVLPRILETLKKEGYEFRVIASNQEPLNFWKDKRQIDLLYKEVGDRFQYSVEAADDNLWLLFLLSIDSEWTQIACPILSPKFNSYVIMIL